MLIGLVRLVMVQVRNWHRKAHGNDKSSDFPLINWLYEKHVVRFITIAPDSDNNKHKRCYIGLSSNRNNDNMNALFEGLENNVCFFKKYKKEILDLSKMKNSLDEGFDYASLYFLGYIDRLFIYDLQITFYLEYF